MQDSRASGQTGAMDENANRLYRAMNGHDIDDADRRAEHFMVRWLDGLVHPGNRSSIKAALAENFAALKSAVLPALSPPAIGDGEMRRAVIAECMTAVRANCPCCDNGYAPESVPPNDPVECQYCGIPLNNMRALMVALHTDEKKGG